jgi:hypothetical protein
MQWLTMTRDSRLEIRDSRASLNRFDTCVFATVFKGRMLIPIATGNRCRCCQPTKSKRVTSSTAKTSTSASLGFTDWQTIKAVGGSSIINRVHITILEVVQSSANRTLHSTCLTGILPALLNSQFIKPTMELSRKISGSAKL